FDEEKKEFKVFDKNNIILHNYFKEKKYFEIKIFNKEGEEKLHVNLLGADSGESEKLNTLNGFKYEYGDIIKLWFAEPAKESIDGNIIDAKEDYSNKIQNRDFIDNVVFEITENGLKSIYNNAPEIKGVENLKLRLKTPFNKLTGVLVTDDHDGDITNKLIVNGEVNTEAPGNYPVEYKVIDKWGRESKVIRMITVSEPSKLESNIIHIDSLSNEDKKDIFKIGFDDFESKIKIYDSKEDFINNSNVSEKNIYIKIIGKGKKEKLLVNLNGDDKGTTEKLNPLKDFKYEYGDIIKLWSVNGSKQRIEGEIVEGKENYSDGIQGVEVFSKIDNVEFEITKDGLKAVYNNAPEIKGVEDINIKIGDLFNKIEGVTAIDLEDGDISKKVAVAGTVDTTKEGESLLEYSVIDKDGNKTIVTRKVIVSEKKALEKNIICTEGIGRVKHRDKFKIGFNEDKKEIKVYSQSWSHLHNYYLKKDYFKIVILDKNLK
ncbi:MAG: immunoglobulin-like domain-containing protein, partial [Sarcina sp.]